MSTIGPSGHHLPGLPVGGPTLTGQIAELERQHLADQQQIADAELSRDDWCNRFCEARRDRDAATRYLSNEITRLQAARDFLRAERDQARAELATAKALGSRSGW